MTNRTYSRHHPGRLALVIDWETSGSDFGGDSTKNYQGLAYGAAIVDTETWTEVDAIKKLLHFDDTKYKWSDGAEKIHGLSREYLKEHGVPRDEALAALIEFLMKYFAPGTKILIVGHNVEFDKDFTLQLFRDFDLEELISFHHVLVDTSGLSFVLIGEYKSDVVFDLLGGIDKRGLHDPLDDVRAVISVLHNAKQIFQTGLNATV